MKRKRFTEGQIAHALRQAESGTPATEVFRKLEDLGADVLIGGRGSTRGWVWRS